LISLPENKDKRRRIYTDLVKIVNGYADQRLDYDVVNKAWDARWPMLAQICYEGNWDFYGFDSLLFVIANEGPLSKREFIDKGAASLRTTKKIAAQLIKKIEQQGMVIFKEGAYTIHPESFDSYHSKYYKKAI